MGDDPGQVALHLQRVRVSERILIRDLEGLVTFHKGANPKDGEASLGPF